MSRYRNSSRSTSRSPRPYRSYRSHRVGRAALCVLFRTNRRSYRHRRGLLGPLFERLFGITPARQDYHKYRYYAPRRRTTSTTTGRTQAHTTSRDPGAPAPHLRQSTTHSEPFPQRQGRQEPTPPRLTGPTGKPLTLAEKHAAEYLQRQQGGQSGTSNAPHSTAHSGAAIPRLDQQPEPRTTPHTQPAPSRGTASTSRYSQPPTPPVVAKRNRQFNEVRPSQVGVQTVMDHVSHGNQKFQPLPPPNGAPPYHLGLDHILPPDQIAAIEKSQRILLHVAGDTGGVKSPEAQQIVAMAMEDQFNFPDATMRPAFFYHLGDVVYYFGESREYYAQFYDPYIHYPAPIFAIPGNHDGDMTDGSAPSLTAFANNFCAPAPQLTAEAGEAGRDAMTQPNVYWTLVAPFVTIIGLYSNVPEGGKLDDQQIEWFHNELSTAPKDKALFVAVHHPVYSADSHHSGSKYIGQVLDNAFSQTGRLPDMVFNGHVHNYQRFTRTLGGVQIPYIVAGAGGYWHLHYMSKQSDGSSLPIPYRMPDVPEVTLEQYCDNRHGFLRLMVTPQYVTGEYFTVPHNHEGWRDPSQRIDGFVIDLKQRKLVKNDAVRWQAQSTKR